MNTLARVGARVRLIVNPAAGGGRAERALESVERALRGHGLVVRCERTRDLAHARQLAREAAGAGETVVCFSGDGMVGAVADVLRRSPGALLGVLPGGRGNDLARALGIPRDPVDACATVARGVARALDLGEVNGRAFVGIASAGFDSDANRIANEAPSWLGGLVYAYGALRALLAWKPARFTVRLIDGEGASHGARDLHGEGASHGARSLHGEERELLGYTVAAANSCAYGGGMLLAPDARLDDGLLDVVEVGRVSKARFLANLPRVFRGTHVKLSSVRVSRASEVEISSDRPFTLYADGDPIAELPARVRVLPGAVRVLVPVAGADGAFDGTDAGRSANDARHGPAGRAL